jgi:hypothetical protein
MFFYLIRFTLRILSFILILNYSEPICLFNATAMLSNLPLFSQYGLEYIVDHLPADGEVFMVVALLIIVFDLLDICWKRRVIVAVLEVAVSVGLVLFLLSVLGHMSRL